MAGSTTFVTPDLGPDRPTHTNQAAGKQRGKRIVFFNVFFVASVVIYTIQFIQNLFLSHLSVLFCLFLLFVQSMFSFSLFLLFCFSGLNVNFSAFYSVVGVFLLVFFCLLIFSSSFFLCASFSFFISVHFQLFKTVFPIFPCFNINFKE